jgi:CTP synthase
MAKFVFVTGGVCSSLGKGITTASLGALLLARGYTVRLRKLEQYLNIDSGTMSPIQHGEVFVTNDGLETDLDLGHYERFTGIDNTKDDYVTMGLIYDRVLKKERRGDYLGATVQIIPHVTDEIKNFIAKDADTVDFVLCEIGGTVGDIEGQAFLEAARQLRIDLGNDHTMFIHLTLIPYMNTSGEIKTKPTQHSVKFLQSLGIQPDLLLCRSEQDIEQSALDKIALFCNVQKKRVVIGRTATDVYQVPLLYHNAGLDVEVCKYFSADNPIDLKKLHVCIATQSKGEAQKQISVGIIGKYLELKDAYKSLIEAIRHAGFALNIPVDIHYLDAETYTEKDLMALNAVIIAGGFGERGTEGKLNAIRFARENKVPLLGICLGMQLSVIEFLRNVVGIKAAGSTEFGQTDEPAVGMITEWTHFDGYKAQGSANQKGGTMRLGAYECALQKDTLARKLYNNTSIQERHRHRYEVNKERYEAKLEANGMIISGASPDGALPEIIELNNHPFFVGVQFHPELKSRPFCPHPLFVGLLQSALSFKNA